MIPAWMRDAACLDYPADWWHPSTPEDKQAALSICRGCPVQAQCLQYALDTEPADVRSGVWGATLPWQRDRLAEAAGWRRWSA